MKLSKYFSKDLIWVRWGYKYPAGIALTRKPPLFSERLGIIKFIKLGFGWRLEILC